MGFDCAHSESGRGLWLAGGIQRGSRPVTMVRCGGPDHWHGRWVPHRADACGRAVATRRLNRRCSRCVGRWSVDEAIPGGCGRCAWRWSRDVPIASPVLPTSRSCCPGRPTRNEAPYGRRSGAVRPVALALVYTSLHLPAPSKPSPPAPSAPPSTPAPPAPHSQHPIARPRRRSTTTTTTTTAPSPSTPRTLLCRLPDTTSPPSMSLVHALHALHA